MKALVTGITSFHGGHIARELVSNGYEVYGLLRHVANREFIMDGVEMVKGDIRDYEAMDRIISSINPHLIVHLAAQSPVEYSFTHEDEVLNVNFMGTVNVAKSAYKRASNLEKFMLASSVEVYGNQPITPLTEDMPPNPASPYGVAKTAAETYVRYLSRGYGFPGVMLRTANTYGRSKTDYFIVERIIHKMLQGEKVIKLGNPKPIRDFLYVDDELSAYMSLIDCKSDKIFGEVYNTGTGLGCSIEHLFTFIKWKIGGDTEPQWYSNSPRPYEISSLVASPEKLRNITGWEAKVGLGKGLDLTIEKWK